MRAGMIIAAGLALAGCGAPDSVPVERVLKNIDAYYGRTVTMKATFRSGARCRLASETGEWQTYCKDCQYCRGPLVVDTGDTPVDKNYDWAMVLGGTHDYKDIRCKGPLGKIECYPFVLGKAYVVRGVLERSKPPKLLVSKFWPVDD